MATNSGKENNVQRGTSYYDSQNRNTPLQPRKPFSNLSIPELPKRKLSFGKTPSPTSPSKNFLVRPPDTDNKREESSASSLRNTKQENKGMNQLISDNAMSKISPCGGLVAEEYTEVEEEWPEIEHVTKCVDPRNGCIECLPPTDYYIYFEDDGIQELSYSDEEMQPNESLSPALSFMPLELPLIPVEALPMPTEEQC